MIFVTGVNGQLGHDVMNELALRGTEAAGSDLTDTYAGAADASAVTRMPYYSLDLTNAGSVRSLLLDLKPEAVIHCAAWTAVDAAEEEANRPLVEKINAGAVKTLAEICKELSVPMMYISTDYVFNGQGTDPWEPDNTDYAPLNVYGKTKLEGENAVRSLLEKYFIVRIAWVFGKSGKNYIRTMLNLGKTHDHLRIVSDQIGTPTYTYDLSKLLCDMIATDHYGTYHATNSELPDTETGDSEEGCKTGFISWYDFTKEIFRQAAAMGYSEYLPEHVLVEPVTTAEYGISKAKRPFNSRLDKSKLVENGFSLLPTWQDAVKRYLEEILPELN